VAECPELVPAILNGRKHDVVPRPERQGAQHPVTIRTLRWFSCDDLPVGHRWHVSDLFAVLAGDLAAFLGDGPEFRAGLSALLETREFFIHQAIEDNRGVR
jgi:hypothetical protein